MSVWFRRTLPHDVFPNDYWKLERLYLNPREWTAACDALLGDAQKLQSLCLLETSVLPRDTWNLQHLPNLKQLVLNEEEQRPATIDLSEHRLAQILTLQSLRVLCVPLYLLVYFDGFHMLTPTQLETLEVTSDDDVNPLEYPVDCRLLPSSLTALSLADCHIFNLDACSRVTIFSATRSTTEDCSSSRSFWKRLDVLSLFYHKSPWPSATRLQRFASTNASLNDARIFESWPHDRLTALRIAFNQFVTHDQAATATFPFRAFPQLRELQVDSLLPVELVRETTLSEAAAPHDSGAFSPSLKTLRIRKFFQPCELIEFPGALTSLTLRIDPRYYSYESETIGLFPWPATLTSLTVWSLHTDAKFATSLFQAVPALPHLSRLILGITSGESNVVIESRTLQVLKVSTPCWPQIDIDATACPNLREVVIKEKQKCYYRGPPTARVRSKKQDHPVPSWASRLSNTPFHETWF